MKNALSPDESAAGLSARANTMYEVERKNAAKLIGIERKQYLFAFMLIVIGLTAAMLVFKASYQFAAAMGGLGALCLILAILCVPQNMQTDAGKKPAATTDTKGANGSTTQSR